MKKLILISILFVLVLSVQAQSFKYLVGDIPNNLFKDVVIENPTYMSSSLVKSGDVYLLPRLATSNTATLFKLSGTISTGAMVYDQQTKSIEPEAWVGSGPVFSLRQYKPDALGNAYQTFGVGLGLLVGTNVELVGTNVDEPIFNLSQLKGTLHFEIRDWASIGYGYAIITPNPDRRHAILFNTRFDF
jgi:hypothetical protein